MGDYDSIMTAARWLRMHSEASTTGQRGQQRSERSAKVREEANRKKLGQQPTEGTNLPEENRHQRKVVKNRSEYAESGEVLLETVIIMKFSS